MAQPIREMLDSREREVRRSIDDIRLKQLAPLERELAEIVAARKAIGSLATNADLFAGVPDSSDSNDHFMRMTMMELARKALTDHFKKGATIGELLDFIRSEYGREIAQGSFSPVLSRLKTSGEVEKSGKVWRLAEDWDL